MKFTKHDHLKARLDLLPPDALELVGFVLRYGALFKYSPENWRKCKDPERYIAPMLRHVLKHMKGEYTDKESGLLHLAHAVTSGLFALDIFIKLGQSKSPSMERKQFNYFAIVERKSKKRGVVKKRFRSYEAAWEWLTEHELEPSSNIIRTVKTSEKLGDIVII